MKRSLLAFLLWLFIVPMTNSYAQIFNKLSKEVKKAEEFISKNQYADALKSLGVAQNIAKGKDEIHIFYLMGYCEFSMGQFDKAIVYFNNATSTITNREILPAKTDELAIKALLYRIRSQEELKNYNEAISDLQLLTTIQDNNTIKSLSYQKWAEDLYFLDHVKNRTMAELLIHNSIKLNAKNTMALKLMSQLEIDARSYEKAIPLIENAISLTEVEIEKPILLSLLGISKYKTGKSDEAYKNFELAVELTPESSKWKTYRQLADLIIKNHLYDVVILEKATHWATRAAILSPDCSIKITLAYLQVLNNKLAAASETLRGIECENDQLKMNSSFVRNQLSELSKAKKVLTMRAYGSKSWYYWGTTKSGIPEGKGKALSKDFLYEVKDAVFKKGVIVYGSLNNIPEGWNYTGSFLNEVSHGNGKIIYANGDTYSGKFDTGLPNGHGIWSYADSSVYEGTVVNGIPHGPGILKQKNGLVYKGLFKNGKQDRSGILIQKEKEMNVVTNGKRLDAKAFENTELMHTKSKVFEQPQPKESEIAKTEKRKKFGKILGKTLVLAGGAVALKEAADLGMDSKDVGELGAALINDVISDGKDDIFISSLKQKNASGTLASSSILGNTANHTTISSLFSRKKKPSDDRALDSDQSSDDSPFTSAGSQPFAEGNYTTSDGKLTIQLKTKGNNLILVDPYTTSMYTPVGGNTYTFTSKNTGTVYMIQIVNSTTIKTYKKGFESQGTLISFSGDSEKGATGIENKKYFAIAQKYKEWMQSDPKDAQLWALCAAAANARASLNESGYQDYARKVSFSLKQIVVNPSMCPCEDAIDPLIWNSTK